MYTVVLAAVLAGCDHVPHWGQRVTIIPSRDMPDIGHGCYGWGFVFLNPYNERNAHYMAQGIHKIQVPAVPLLPPVWPSFDSHEPSLFGAPVVAAAPAQLPARLTIAVPAGAKLFIDNQACPTTANVCSFSTAALQPGERYYYTVRLEQSRDGRNVVQTRRIQFAAGQNLYLDLAESQSGQAAGAAR